MLLDWERKFPGRGNSIFAALQNVSHSHLADPKLFDFAALGAKQPPRQDWLVSEPAEEGEDVLVATVAVEDLMRTLPRERAAAGEI
jgi:tRNA 2-thiocytidine biosynthesis protein TtcA